MTRHFGFGIASLFVAAAMLVTAMRTVNAAPACILEWSPARLTVAIAPGRSQDVTASFTASEKLSGGQFVAVPELRQFVYVQSGTDVNAAPGAPNAIRVIITVPATEVPGTTHEGTLRVVTGNRTIAQSLKVILTVVAPTDDHVPVLISPEPGVLLDNGRLDFSDPIVWDFDWSDVATARSYHLYVRAGPTSLNPAIDTFTTDSSFHSEVSNAYIADHNRFGWWWRVQALVDGVWSDWSEIRFFDVEPLNTD